jgi:hypothetical protein
MNAALLVGNEDAPRVAVVCDAPVVYAALEDVLAGLASLTKLDGSRDDLVGLIESLAPDAVVIASEEGDERADELAATFSAPIVRLSLREPCVRVFIDSEWQDLRDERASPEAIRNIVVGAIVRRNRRR